MDDNSLKEYKTKLGNLSVNDKKMRDLYLRKLALGEIQGPPTGYASIDKPWLKHYSEDQILKDFEPMSVYQLMYNRNIEHDNEVAIEYFGNKITYGNLLKKIDLTAKSLLELGVKKGDVVLQEELKIEKLNIAEIKPYSKNAKRHPKKQIEQIKKSIQDFGFNDPIAIDENNVIIERTSVAMKP